MVGEIACPERVSCLFGVEEELGYGTDAIFIETVTRRHAGKGYTVAAKDILPVVFVKGVNTLQRRALRGNKHRQERAKSLDALEHLFLWRVSYRNTVSFHLSKNPVGDQGCCGPCDLHVAQISDILQ
ncbi:hypothetical protein RJ55_04344 [Drechmeria coniospora]|nr:hypothetical protein RJ55_04344 [Drechmeria coniospora]